MDGPATPADDVALGLRVQNRNDRREALVRAAYTLFEARGFDATTMDDIAAAAGLSRRTAFRYFPTKEELLFPEREARLAELRRQLAPRDGETAFATVRRASLAMARRYEEERELMLRQHRLVTRSPALMGREQVLDRAFEAMIEDAFARGPSARDGARARRRARVRAAAVVGAIRATLREWLEEGASGDLARLGRETFAELASGFGDDQ